MAVRDVLQFPDARLKQVCAPRDAWAGDARQLHTDMVETMRAHPGCVGIAAPQIGELVRAIAVDVTGHKRAQSDHGLLVLFDPVVVEDAGRVTMREGCLSIPDFTGNVTRPESLVLEAHDVDGAQLRIAADAYECRVLLHELDHLDGVLFLDRVASARDIFPRKRYR